MTKLAHYDIVGSFLRPEELKEARKNFNQEKISQEELTKIEDQEIKQNVVDILEGTMPAFDLRRRKYV